MDDADALDSLNTAPAPAATSLTDASNQLAAALAQRLTLDSVAAVQTGTLGLASGPSADTKDVSPLPGAS